MPDRKTLEDLDRYLKENYTGPDRDWPVRWWEPGCEDINDAPPVKPGETWIPDEIEIELPFK